MFVTNQCVPFYLSSKYIVEKKKKKTAQSRYMYSEIKKKKIKTLMGYLQISNSFKARLSLFYFLSIYLLIFFSFIHFPFIIIIINFFFLFPFLIFLFWGSVSFCFSWHQTEHIHHQEQQDKTAMRLYHLFSVKTEQNNWLQNWPLFNLFGIVFFFF